MTKLGIVGHEMRKFTAEKGDLARQVIRDLINLHEPDWVISGRCPLGGIDIWAIEEAQRLGVKTFEFAPTHHVWGGPGGYRERNLKIAAKCDRVVCVVVRELPSHYEGMSFDGCYHCVGQVDDPGDHVKSGGCWTARRCRSRSWIIL